MGSSLTASGSVAAKVPTTHFDLTRSVMACLAEGAAAFETSLEDFLADVGLFRLATTIGTNAVVTGSGDPVGLMVEAGAEKSLYGPNEPAPALGVFVRADHVVGVAPRPRPRRCWPCAATSSSRACATRS